MSQGLKDQGHICGAYYPFGRHSIVYVAIAAVALMEREVISGIEVDEDTIEVD
jgi:hypothetical protein